MIGAGTIINPILKIVTTVAILGAAYIFIVKPVLDTTEDISANVSRTSRQASADFDLNFAKDRAESFASSLRTQWPQAAREVTECVRQADKDAKAMERCDDFGHELVTQGQSPRNFSLSYADSLSSQGKAAEAAQVERCVEEAAFNVRALQRCRALADRLLFP
ncbi:MAG: hypothetical protein M3Y34_02420 [Actinomycetota bacterium]|nr:hypothetical protein [Actinomycetota bacterium]